MALLCDNEIIEMRTDGKILIYPFREELLNTNSYDVCLGENYYIESPTTNGLFNIWNKTSVENVWQKGESISKLECQQQYPSEDLASIPDEARIILLQPGQSILGHTEEFIGGITQITSHMFCRSSYGRCGLTVCRCSGLGDVGYYTRWTMEITNNNKYNAIPLIIGQPIAQIVFYKLGRPETQVYSDKGHYQHQSYLTNSQINMSDLISSWHPDNMLPKLYLTKF